MTTVKDVMSTRVMAVRKWAPFKEIAARLREQRISAFPVIDDDGKVIGVISEADLLAKEALGDDGPAMPGASPRRRERAKAEGTVAADLMTGPAVTIGPDASVADAARLMYSRRVKRLPVTGEDGRLIGIVSRSDVLSVYSRPDEDIRREIIEGLALNTAVRDPARFTVTVSDGVVTIEGTPGTAAAARGIVGTARRAEGVVAVRDRLTYPPA